jgi:hypothetical protein
MPTTRTFFRSFAGGELSPEMFGRLDDVKFQTGAAKLLNFIATPQGPAENRPGTRFVKEVKDSTKKTRIIPFTYSTTQTMVLEFGNGYLRFHTNAATLQVGTPAAYNAALTYAVGALVSSGGLVYYATAAVPLATAPPNASFWYLVPTTAYEIPTPYQEADLFGLHYVQSGDVLTIVHPNYAPRELRRLGATTWVLSTILFASPIPAPAAPTVTAIRGRSMNISGITTAAIAVITTVADHNLTDGDPIEISGVLGMTQANGFWIVHKNTPSTKLEVQYYTTGAHFDSTTFTAYGGGGSIQYANQSQDLDNFYVITSIASNGLDESVASPPGTVFNNLNVTGASNDLTWTAVPGALRYNIYKRQSGLYGYIGQTSSNAFTDDNIAPDMGTTPPMCLRQQIITHRL